MTRDVWVVIPIKRLEHAKQRLAPAFTSAARQALVCAMLADVLDAVVQVNGLRVAIATSDPAVARIALQAGAAVFADEADQGYSATATAAGRRLALEGRAGVMILPGDVPAITAAEVRGLLLAHRPGRAVTIVPSHDRAGTNAILATPPDALPFAFGPDSFRRHCDSAILAGIQPTVLSPPGIGLDLDHPEDVALFLRSTAPTHTRAALTAGAIAE